MDGSFEGGVILGNLENGGVGLAPFHDLDSMVPAELKTELDQIKATSSPAQSPPPRAKNPLPLRLNHLRLQ